MKRVHPDGAEKFRADREAAVDPANPRPYAHEYRVRPRDGEVRWVDALLLLRVARERRLVSFVGTV